MLQPLSINSRGQPVEQFGMRRRSPFAAEIEDGRDERLSHVTRPHDD